MVSAVGSAVATRVPVPFGAPLSLSDFLSVSYGNTGLQLCPAVVQSGFGFFIFTFIFPFGMWMLIL